MKHLVSVALVTMLILAITLQVFPGEYEDAIEGARSTGTSAAGDILATFWSGPGATWGAIDRNMTATVRSARTRATRTQRAAVSATRSARSTATAARRGTLTQRAVARRTAAAVATATQRVARRTATVSAKATQEAAIAIEFAELESSIYDAATSALSTENLKAGLCNIPRVRRPQAGVVYAPDGADGVNIHSGPGEEHPVAGTLPSWYGVLLYERRLSTEGEYWWRISFEEDHWIASWLFFERLDWRICQAR